MGMGEYEAEQFSAWVILRGQHVFVLAASQILPPWFFIFILQMRKRFVQRI
jgi:hypothetical protein